MAKAKKPELTMCLGVDSGDDISVEWEKDAAHPADKEGKTGHFFISTGANPLMYVSKEKLREFLKRAEKLLAEVESLE